MRGCSGGGACMVLFRRGGMCGFIWGGMHGFIRGVCMVLFGGVHGFIQAGMHGFSGGEGACVVFSVFSDTMRYGQSYWNAFLCESFYVFFLLHD